MADHGFLHGLKKAARLFPGLFLWQSRKLLFCVIMGFLPPPPTLTQVFSIPMYLNQLAHVD